MKARPDVGRDVDLLDLLDLLDVNVGLLDLLDVTLVCSTSTLLALALTG